MIHALLLRDDGSVIDVPREHVPATLARHPGWKEVSSVPKQVPIKVPSNRETCCQICGRPPHPEHP